MRFNKDILTGMVMGVFVVIAFGMGMSAGSGAVYNNGQSFNKVNTSDEILHTSGEVSRVSTVHYKPVEKAACGVSSTKRSKPSQFDRIVEAIIAVESSSNRKAVGKAGERGLLQIKYQTWRFVCKNLLGKDIPWSWAFNEEYNRMVGTAYLRYCIKKSGGDMDWGIVRYNKGHNYRGGYRGYLRKVKARIR